MLVKPPLEKLLENVENRYTLAITIAKRTRQLVSGAQPMAKSESPNLVTLACEELAAEEIVAVPEDVIPIVPLRPEVREALDRATREEEDSLDAEGEIELEAPKPTAVPSEKRAIEKLMQSIVEASMQADSTEDTAEQTEEC